MMKSSHGANGINNSDSSTVILGCGIIGLCTAYYLSESGNTSASSITLVDTSEELFQCASGLAGGFLVQDWFAPSVASLGALSFKLHAQLAQAHNGRAAWGYLPSTGISLSQDSEAAVSGSGEDWLENGTSRAQLAVHNRPWEEESSGPEWLRRTKEGTMETISRDGTTAQIDPLRFCRWLLAMCKARGVQVRYPARATTIVKNEKKVLKAVRIFQDGAEVELPCTRLVFTSGAWTPRIFRALFPTASTRIPISPLAGHSLLVRNPQCKSKELENDTCHAVFATDTLGFSPEWFSRAGGELYLAGLNSTMIPFPDVATDVVPNEKAIHQLKQCARVMMAAPPGRSLEVIREALCFRPVTSSGRPIISRIPDEKLGGVKTHAGAEGGVFIAAGHGAWGISHAPATGMVLTEIIEGRKTSAKVDALRLS